MTSMHRPARRPCRTQRLAPLLVAIALGAPAGAVEDSLRTRPAAGSQAVAGPASEAVSADVTVSFSPPAAEARGGPDAFGYTWADSDSGVTTALPAYTPTNLRAMGFMGDDAVIRLPLPTTIFPTGFPFYGTSYPAVWLSSNGWLSFVDPAGNSAPVPAAVPAPGAPNALVAFFWDDWTLEASVPFADAGPNAAGDGYTIRIRLARAGTPGTYCTIYVTLYTNGSIKVIYFGPVDLLKSSVTSIGIEDAAGAVGLPFMTAGAAHNGASFRGTYAVQFYPRGRLDCATGPTPIACGPPVTTDNLAGATNVSGYGCAASSYTGRERVFALTLARTSHVTATVSNTGGRTLHAFLIEPSCSEWTGCTAGGAASIQRSFVPPGTYYVVVDAATPADDGTFTLDVQCQNATTLVPCNTTLTGESTSGTGSLTSWSCQANPLPGPERIYEVSFTAPALLHATLSNATDPGMRMLASSALNFNGASPSCFAASTGDIRIWNATTGTYLFTVDSTATAGGSYDLQVQCRRDLVCPSPPDVIDPASTTPIVGDTAGGPANVDEYFCDLSGFGGSGTRLDYTGPERVYEFTLASPQDVAFLLSAASSDMHALLLDDCFEGACVIEGACRQTLAAGTYRLVIDGINGAEGPFSLQPFQLPTTPYNIWTDCPECTGTCAQGPTDVRLRQWSFDSGNYCGTGCDFSLFVVVECGTEFHIPFRDVETGHVQIWDVLGSRYMDLTATNDLPANPTLPANCRFTTTGTLVQWEDTGCSAIPCPGANCGGGADCRTNDTVIDVSFAQQPNACGVYRIDFLNWGGFAWDVFANCSGDALPQFYLYKDLCTAVANYNPLPEAGLASVTPDDLQCGTLTASGTMTLRNNGCGPALGVQVVIEQSPPLPPNPMTIVVDIPDATPVTVNWTYPLTSAPANLVFQVDPANRIRECSESTGTSSQCGGTVPIQDQVAIGACTGGCANLMPPAAGNTLKAVKSASDAVFTWSPITAVQIGGYRLFRDTARPVPPASRSQIAQVAPMPTSYRHVNAVALPPMPIGYYQLVGLSCRGDIEGPY